jgi:hypothetical protein
MAAGAALGASAAISTLRRRSRRADRGQSNNHHQKVLHESPPVEFDFISLTPGASRRELMVRRAAVEQADDRIVTMKRRSR